jgi:hypothetical protein
LNIYYASSATFDVSDRVIPSRPSRAALARLASRTASIDGNNTPQYYLLTHIGDLCYTGVDNQLIVNTLSLNA